MAAAGGWRIAEMAKYRKSAWRAGGASAGVKGCCGAGGKAINGGVAKAANGGVALAAAWRSEGAAGENGVA